MSLTTSLLILAGLAAVLAVIWHFTRYKKISLGDGSSFPPGTRAFESEMSLPILARMVEARELLLLDDDLDEAKRVELTTQIANMRKQAALHRAVIDARDISPGRMSIGVDPDSDQID